MHLILLLRQTQCKLRIIKEFKHPHANWANRHRRQNYGSQKARGQVAKDLVDASKRRREQQWGTLRNHEVHSYPFKHSGTETARYLSPHGRERAELRVMGKRCSKYQWRQLSGSPAVRPWHAHCRVRSLG